MPDPTDPSANRSRAPRQGASRVPRLLSALTGCSDHGSAQHFDEMPADLRSTRPLAGADSHVSKEARCVTS